eukprot:g4762.t1
MEQVVADKHKHKDTTSKKILPEVSQAVATVIANRLARLMSMLDSYHKNMTKDHKHKASGLTPPQFLYSPAATQQERSRAYFQFFQNAIARHFEDPDSLLVEKDEIFEALDIRTDNPSFTRDSFIPKPYVDEILPFAENNKISLPSLEFATKRAANAFARILSAYMRSRGAAAAGIGSSEGGSSSSCSTSPLSLASILQADGSAAGDKWQKWCELQQTLGKKTSWMREGSGADWNIVLRLFGSRLVVDEILDLDFTGAGGQGQQAKVVNAGAPKPKAKADRAQQGGGPGGADAGAGMGTTSRGTNPMGGTTAPPAGMQHNYDIPWPPCPWWTMGGPMAMGPMAMGPMAMGPMANAMMAGAVNPAMMGNGMMSWNGAAAMGMAACNPMMSWNWFQNMVAMQMQQQQKLHQQDRSCWQKLHETLVEAQNKAAAAETTASAAVAGVAAAAKIIAANAKENSAAEGAKMKSGSGRVEGGGGAAAAVEFSAPTTSQPHLQPHPYPLQQACGHAAATARARSHAEKSSAKGAGGSSLESLKLPGSFKDSNENNQRHQEQKAEHSCSSASASPSLAAAYAAALMSQAAKSAAMTSQNAAGAANSVGANDVVVPVQGGVMMPWSTAMKMMHGGSGGTKC